MNGPTTKESAAYQAIRQAIIQGALRPGQSVTIRELAAQFALGRTPVSEAMKRLALEGWLESAPGIGTRVVQLDLADRFAYMQVRAAMEALSVRLCAELSDAEAILSLDHCLAVERLAIERQNLVRAIEADIEFHRLCARLSGNRFLSLFYEQLISQDELVFYRNIHDADIRLESHEQHIAIADAIRAGDPDLAESASRKHSQTILGRLAAEHGGQALTDTEEGGNAGETPAP